MKGTQIAEGIVFIGGEPTPIYQVFCPVCGSDMLEPDWDNWTCLRCGSVFDTKEDE